MLFKKKQKPTKTDTEKAKFKKGKVSQKKNKKQSSTVVKSKEKQKEEDFKVRRKAGVPLSLLKKHEFGCGRCRNRPYCTRSCWSLRGFSI